MTCPITLYTLFCLFQSTPSLWKVTAGEKMVTAKFQISIHTFPAKGDKRLSLITIYLIISIHTFLAEGDIITTPLSSTCTGFQSTPSLRKVTTLCRYPGGSIIISIHTFLAEGDSTAAYVMDSMPNFNPHLPCGR